jgi:hypothetical protein
MKIALFITATGKYTEFLPKLIQSADKYFLPQQEVVYVIFVSDIATPLPETKRDIEYIEVEHKPFPETSMWRSYFYSKYLSDFNHYEKFTHCFAIDADAYFASEINPLICMHNIVCVAHGAYINRTDAAPFETNANSSCFAHKPTIYVGGGFYGGQTDNFKAMCGLMFLYLQNDKFAGITPIWHDESAINKFVCNNEPLVKILPPTYHYCEHEPGKLNPYMHELWMENKEYIKQRWAIEPPFTPKIIFVDKDKAAKGTNYYRN